jgi:hypothetical protein
MSDASSPSSHTGGVPQPINPYEPSRSSDRTDLPQNIASEDHGHHFQSRLDWADRQALLRSVGPTRVAIVLSSLLWMKSGYEYVAAWATALAGEARQFTHAVDWAIGLLAVLWLVQGALTLYLCWLNWHYCDRLQAAAGGHSNSWNAWSRLHYRTARLSLAIYVLAFAVEAGWWLMSRWEIAEGFAQ